MKTIGKMTALCIKYPVVTMFGLPMETATHRWLRKCFKLAMQGSLTVNQLCPVLDNIGILWGMIDEVKVDI
ncbi:hypothetical protein BKL49_00390 [Rodentibacter myodis]|uniref:Uncharacterized protein n=1 Tax=Rodentibacter myodis TaxID=1907939 RepID=A0A1V3JUP6_9PAST|nr:hypothetical protein BKL49_00390 [Rodentibacter myodis]